MKNIWLFSDELKNTENYLYGDGWNAKHMYRIFEKHKIPVHGFIRAYSDEHIIYGLPVFSLEQMMMMRGNILLTQNKWQGVYDYLIQKIDTERIYTLANWENSDSCIVCGYDKTMQAGAEFVPFLQERMFRGKKKETAIVHCTYCGMYYAKYRPTDDEMNLLYFGYRNYEYQKMRQKYEPTYTVEFNNSLSDPKDESGRRAAIYDFISSKIDINSIDTVLDFGGDRGQFIPDEFSSKRRVVYEISGVQVMDGIELVTDKKMLNQINPELILCNMVMEHVSDIKLYFDNLVSLMKKGSFLYIEVPNEHWCVDQEYVRFHEHINFFADKTFSVLASQSNIEVIKLDHDSTVIRALFTK